MWRTDRCVVLNRKVILSSCILVQRCQAKDESLPFSKVYLKGVGMSQSMTCQMFSPQDCYCFSKVTRKLMGSSASLVCPSLASEDHVWSRELAPSPQSPQPSWWGPCCPHLRMCERFLLTPPALWSRRQPISFTEYWKSGTLPIFNW